jgi:GH15 family glucan-1,4-alpha-glucosidase
MINLFDQSIEVILNFQYPSGAFIASPSFKQYAYCWFRDSSFIAYAMDLVGEHNSAQKFHNWAADTICRHEHVAERAIEKNRKKLGLGTNDVLHARYTLDGSVGKGKWPSFQLDGLGTWLWALREHMRLANVDTLPPLWSRAVKITANYLCHLWPLPNYDCWEEFGDKIHTYTLGAIYTGLRAVSQFLDKDIPVEEITSSIRETILTKCTNKDHLIKFIGADIVDASLLGLSTPYRLFEPNDPIMLNTVTRIENELRLSGGGVHRYNKDTYYGGGEWVLLAAWLGWYYTEIGLIQKAQGLLSWIEDQADERGNLPEQIPINLIDHSYLEFWIKKHGTIACPLLWSHANYLILVQALKNNS